MPGFSRDEISFYMERTAKQLTPPNFWYRCRRSFSNGIGFYVLATLVLVVVVGIFSNLVEYKPVWDTAGIMALAAIALFAVSEVLAREPGYWQRYSPYQCYERFPHFYRHLLPIVEAVRKEDPRAEFEVRVLERDHEYFGAVLFQMILRYPVSQMEHTDAGSAEIELKESILLQVFSLSGEPVESDHMLREVGTGLAL